MVEMKEMKIEGSIIHILPVIHGLSEEGKNVEKAINKINPDCVAIGISKEDVEAIKNYDGKMEMPPQYEYYLFYLSNYGKVAVPPPDIKKAYEICLKKDIEIAAIDVDDDEYADLLVKHVSIISLIRQSRKMKKLKNKNFRARNAREFVFEWDNYMTSVKAFKKIEEARERKMALNLRNLAKRFKKILAIIPLERYDGVIENLENKLERYKK
ncbi:MAG: hypothetical protein FE044_02730 [Thermoplasmata archaeon]|nr:MAG: hypothetical protein FE044_02730 [Thermoplasmata archaeon]